MKLAVGVLIMLGMLAAGSAVLVVNVVQARLDSSREENRVPVLVAASDLPARKLLDGNDLEVKPVPAPGLPQGYFIDPSQAVGKVLKLGAVKGQPLTAVLLTEPGVADLLRPGMRAFTFRVSGRTTSSQLLQPGSIVDVSVTLPLRRREIGDALVMCLLQQIRILAINADTIQQEQVASRERDTGPRVSRSGGQATVTLELTYIQTQAMQLVMERGSVSLALRNPTDEVFAQTQIMVLKEGRLVSGSEALDPAELAWAQQFQQVINRPAAGDVFLPPMPDSLAGADANEPNALPGLGPEPVTRTMPPSLPMLSGMDRRAKTRTVEIYRGPEMTEKEVPLDKEETDGEGGG